MPRPLPAPLRDVAAIATSSGQAAETLASLNLARAGESIVASNALYGGTVALFGHTLPRLGIATRFVDANEPAQVARALDETTRAVYVETIGNPELDVPDLRRLADIAHTAGVPLVVDNTFATPILTRPIEHGADIVVHSATKWVGGYGPMHGRSASGAERPPITTRDMARLVRLLVAELAVESVALATGGSLGGMVALEWAATFPELTGSVVVFAAPAAHTAQAIGFHHVQRRATWRSWMQWTRTTSGGGGAGPALRAFRCRLVGVGIPGDLLYSADDVREWVAAAGARYREIRSAHGHDAFLLEDEQVDAILREMLGRGGGPAEVGTAERELVIRARVPT